MQGVSNIQKEERALNFYVLCNSLKDLIRKGWEDWNIDIKRKENEVIFSFF